MILRRRFADVIARQLDLFEEENAELLDGVDLAERAYDDAPRDEAEERYGDFLDLVEEAVEILARMRDAYAARLEEDDARVYAAAFHREVGRRLPHFSQGL